MSLAIHKNDEEPLVNIVGAIMMSFSFSFQYRSG